MTDEEKIRDLQDENQKLKDKLVDFKRLEEDLLTDKVFKAAKGKLVSWYTVGGIAVFVVGMVGVKTVVDYSKDLVSKKLDTYSEAKINEIIIGESHKQVEVLLAKQQDTLNKQFQTLYEYAKKKLDISLNGYGRTVDTSQNPSLTDLSVISKVDISPQMNPIRDELDEGGTVAFTVAAAFEYALYQRDKIQVTLSPRYIYNSINHKNDGGALFVDAFNFLSKTGAVEESVWPYKPGEFAKDPPPAVNTAKHYKISNFKTIKPDINTIKTNLINKQCIIAGIVIFSSMYESTGGVYPTPKPNDQVIGGHGICIVGFDDTKKLIKFRNAWGTGWGDKGYGYIKYDDMNKLITDSYTITL